MTTHNNLDSLTTSARRGKIPTCQFCGGSIPDVRNALHVSIPHQKNGVWGHRECARMLRYHEQTPAWFSKYREKHLTETARITFTPEVEGTRKYNGMDAYEHALYMWAEYKLLPSMDCTVDVEYKSGINVNLHGLGEWFEGVSKMVDMAGPENGLHMNTGWYGMTGNNVNKIFRFRHILLEPLLDYMLENPETTKKIWGRNFNRWANADMDCIHGSWVNLENNIDRIDSQSAARIEWRLPHYVDSKQAKQCAWMVCDFTQILRSFCDGTRTARQASSLILKHYKQACEGRATWQRPERNR